MTESVLRFYESLAEHYHLIFDDWDEVIRRQTKVLGPIVAREISPQPLNILDCACGIGTQAIGFAQLGHHVVASDLSPFAVTRARREAAQRSLNIPFFVSDMTSLQEIPQSEFDMVVALDNALPHLSAIHLTKAIGEIRSKLKNNGLFLASIRDYDKLIHEKPAMQPPAFFGQAGNRRIVHQVWDWIDDTSYIVHLYITIEENAQWKTLHFTSEYRCLLRNELSSALTTASFHDIRWLMPAESGFYQPLILARSLL
jgi:glycine/sarcosine N-methyltransferase